MKLRPLNDRLLIKRVTADEKTKLQDPVFKLVLSGRPDVTSLSDIEGLIQPDRSKRRPARLDEAAQQMQNMRKPVLPGAFPLAIGGKIIYRTQRGITARERTTGKLTWESTLRGGLDNPEHIAAAIGRDFGDVSPVCGVILGGGRQSFSVQVTVERI